MLAITVDENLSGVTIINRALPWVGHAVTGLAVTAFSVFVFHLAFPGILNGEGSWLPPFDKLPKSWKAVFVWLCFVAGIALGLTLTAISLRTLFFAKVWRFDVLARIVTRNGEQVGMLDECQEVIVEGDFRGETDTIAFMLLMKDGRKMTMAQSGAGEAELRRFLEASKAISNRAKIPYRKTTAQGWLSSGQGPTWWTALN
jgi:hypothetical protein